MIEDETAIHEVIEEQATRELNKGQKAASEGVLQFLMNEEEDEFNISGGGGVGKTFLMGKLIDDTIPAYHRLCKILGEEVKYDEVYITALTNKAADVLSSAANRPCVTIHSLLRLTVKNDFSTGKTNIQRRRDWRPIHNKIIFIDECSMIDRALYKEIKDTTVNCKIIYVGDHCQLEPVAEQISPIYNQRIPFYELKEQMRNNGQPALQAICSQLRDTVETGVFKPIKVVPGVIDLLDNQGMETEIANYFTQQTHDTRILAYSNQMVSAYNDHIRVIRNLPNEYTVGEYLVVNTALQIGRTNISVETEVEVLKLGDVFDHPMDDGAVLKMRNATLRTSLGDEFTAPIPIDRPHFFELKKYFSRKKNWSEFFYLNNNVPDLRPRDACTVHKSQGSTYKTTFIDLNNISQCRNPKTAARLLYVAFSRAKEKIFLYGPLADRFGGLCV